MSTKSAYLYMMRIMLTCLLVFLSAQPAGYSQAESENFYVSGTSDKITLELKGVDIIDVLKVLAKKSGLNIVAGKNVRGQVTLFLQNVDVNEALRVVLETSELAYEEENGIIKVITQRDYEAKYGKTYNDQRETEVLTLKYADVQSVSQFLNELKTNIGKIVVDDRSNSLTIIDMPDVLARMKKVITQIDVPVSSKVFSLEYGDVEELESTISEILTPTVGVVKVDKRTNKIAVIDYPEKLRQIEDMILAFDEQPRQVLIEAQIVQVILGDEFEFGIDWDLVMERTEGKDIKFNQNSLGGMASSPFEGVTDLPTFTINNDNDDLHIVITALEGMGKTNTLASPRLTVLNGEEAKISVATQKPYVSQTVVQSDAASTTADNIQFVDVGVIMTVQPQISAQNMVLLKVKPEVSASNEDFTLEQLDSDGNVTGTRTSVPIVTKQEVETTVLVANGHTLVLGGLIEDSEAKLTRKVPVLGDIPILRHAFRHDTVEMAKTELVIFLTPTIAAPKGSADITAEKELFFDSAGTPREFNEFGGADYSYEKTYHHSMSPLNQNNQPYWKKRDASMFSTLNDIVKQRDSGATYEQRAIEPVPAPVSVRTEQPLPVRRTAPASQPIRQATAPVYQAPVVESSSAQGISFYQEVVSAQLNKALANRRDLGIYRGTAGQLVLNIKRNGMVNAVGFSKKPPFNDEDFRIIIRDVISDIMPFPQFPNDISSSEERVTVQISL